MKKSLSEIVQDDAKEYAEEKVADILGPEDEEDSSEDSSEESLFTPDEDLEEDDGPEDFSGRHDPENDHD